MCLSEAAQIGQERLAGPRVAKLICGEATCALEHAARERNLSQRLSLLPFPAQVNAVTILAETE